MKTFRLLALFATMICMSLLVSCSDKNDEPNGPNEPSDEVVYTFSQNNLKFDNSFNEIEIEVTNADQLGDWNVTRFTFITYDPIGEFVYDWEYGEDESYIQKIDSSKFVFRMYANHGYAREYSFKFESVESDAVGYLVVNQESADKPDYIWDYGPLSLSFYVYDEQGVNLVDKMSKEELSAALTVSFRGNEFTLEDGKPMPKRAIAPTWTGLARATDREGEDYLSFGEFEGGGFFRDEEVVIKWSDGSTDTILFSAHIEKAGEIESSYSLNGVAQEDAKFFFVKNL